MAKSTPILKEVPELRVQKVYLMGGEYFIVQEHRQETFRKRWIDVSKVYFNLTSAKADLATKYLDYLQEGEFNGVDH